MLTASSSVGNKQNPQLSVPSGEIVGDLLVLHHLIGRHAVAELRVRVKLAVVVILCCDGSNVFPLGAVAVDIFCQFISLMFYSLQQREREQCTCSAFPEDQCGRRPPSPNIRPIVYGDVSKTHDSPSAASFSGEVIAELQRVDAIFPRGFK